MEDSMYQRLTVASKRLEEIDINRLSPLDALNLINELKEIE